MASLAFDTHKFVTRLTGAGMSAEQAEVLAETYAALITDRLATRDDVTGLRKEMNREFAAVRGEIATLRQDIDREFATLRTEIRKDLAALRSEINARIAYSQLATIVILSAVMGAFRLFG